MTKRRRSVITGIGPLTCIGIGRETFWNSILAEKSGIGSISLFDASPYTAKSAGEVWDYDSERFFPAHRLKRLDRYAQFAVASAFLALEDAKFDWSPEKPQPRVGVSFGTALGGISNAESQHAKFVTGGPRNVSQTIAVQVFGGSAHANIAIECGFQGVGTTNSNSCASGTVAVGEAMRYIRDDWADALIAGGAEAPLSPLTFGAFDMIKSMTRSEAPFCCRPFDKARDGFVMGEGAASLMIEELEHAKNRGAHIYAEVLGYGQTNDAFHMTSSRNDGASAIRAIQQALEDANVSPDQIDYINAHASSTQMNDRNEAHCIHTVFGARASQIPVSGTKAYTAHPLGATGAIEAAICALAIDQGFIPPTLHHETLDPECGLDVVPGHGRKADLSYVLSNSFGFGGINSCIVLGKYPQKSEGG
ncbi:MAG: beta-ketoacyl-[acyl-carrier-protein] synthase family protein [Chthoniobacterales bacterium]